MTLLKRVKITRPPTIREEVYKSIRQIILTGEAEPHMKLVESKLAKEINASRTPVREALHKLEMENLVQAVPRVGYVVKGIDERDVEEICEIRIALESLAAKWAALRIKTKDLKRLEKNIEMAKRAITNMDTQAIVKLDTEFHDIISRASQSKRLMEISQNLRDHMLRFRIKGLCVPEIAKKSNEGHRRIFQAIKKRDLKGIESAVHFHLSQTKIDVMTRIKKPKGSPP